MTSLIRAFREFQEYNSILGFPYKAEAYARAVKAIEEHGPNPAALSGKVGQRIMVKVTEFSRTGQILELAELRELVRNRRELSKVMGAGPATVNAWVAAGISSLAHLRREVRAGNITLTRIQAIGLKYYRDLNTRIPRAEVKAIGGAVCKLIWPGLNAESVIAGSYRRGLQTCGDVDIIAIGSPGDLSALKQDPRVIMLSAGPERLSLLFKLKTLFRQVDILFVQKQNFYAALNYFTGSYEHNIYLRGIAKNMGLRLNQAGLFKDGKPLPLKSEEDIYKHLGLKYIPPTQR